METAPQVCSPHSSPHGTAKILRRCAKIPVSSGTGPYHSPLLEGAESFPMSFSHGARIEK